MSSYLATPKTTIRAVVISAAGWLAGFVYFGAVVYIVSAFVQ